MVDTPSNYQAYQIQNRYPQFIQDKPISKISIQGRGTSNQPITGG
jgi:hypothetical protein